MELRERIVLVHQVCIIISVHSEHDSTMGIWFDETILRALCYSVVWRSRILVRVERFVGFLNQCKQLSYLIARNAPK